MATYTQDEALKTEDGRVRLNSWRAVEGYEVVAEYGDNSAMYDGADNVCNRCLGGITKSGKGHGACCNTRHGECHERRILT